MKIKLWGVIGSCPGRSNEFSKYGSHTSCISVEVGDSLVIFDGGSGLIELAQNLNDPCKYKSIDVFLTHYHFDHIIGIPFTSFLYRKDCTINFHGPINKGFSVESAIKGLFVEPYLPMGFSVLSSNIHFFDMYENSKYVGDGFEVRSTSSDHPGGNLIYSIVSEDKKFTYMTDLGHLPYINSKMIDFAMDSDMIYYDANFLDKEMKNNTYEGWGHSTHEKGIELLEDSGSKFIVLGHHAIHRKRQELDELEKIYSESVIIGKDGDEFNL